MEFMWQVKAGDFKTIKRFLEAKGISHRMYRDLKTASQAITINGQTKLNNGELQLGDTVKVVFADELADPQVAVSNEPLEVVYEDQNWLVVNKPAGLTTVPGPSNREDTLVNRVKGHWLTNHEANLVPHIITRLDRFTSGLVLVAKHRFANSLANEMLAQKLINKRYQAIVTATGLADHGRITTPIGKRDTGIGQIIREDGKPSDTEYWIKQTGPNWTLVTVKLHTGRTHQIRVHFSSIDHPLVGDELYGGPLDWGISRQALHAFELSFTDPFTNKELFFTSQLPKDLQKFLAAQI